MEHALRYHFFNIAIFSRYTHTAFALLAQTVLFHPASNQNSVFLLMEARDIFFFCYHFSFLKGCYHSFLHIIIPTNKMPIVYIATATIMYTPSFKAPVLPPAPPFPRHPVVF